MITMQYMAANGQWRIYEYLSVELVVKRYCAVVSHLASVFLHPSYDFLCLDTLSTSRPQSPLPRPHTRKR